MNDTDTNTAIQRYQDFIPHTSRAFSQAILRQMKAGQSKAETARLMALFARKQPKG